MSERTWIGGIYLREEGGYEIVFRSLEYYKKRLITIGASPELKGAPMFAQLIEHEAAKSSAAVEKIIDRIKECLDDPAGISGIQQDVPLIEKALNCYITDIKKAEEGEEFYLNLIQDMESARADASSIKVALERIGQFA